MDSVWEIFTESFAAFGEFVKFNFRTECNAASIELGAESCIATYLLTKYAFKKPEKAFRVSMISFLAVPIIYWPICNAQRRRALLESGTTVVDTQEEMEKKKESSKAGVDPNKSKLSDVKVDSV